MLLTGCCASPTIVFCTLYLQFIFSEPLACVSRVLTLPGFIKNESISTSKAKSVCLEPVKSLFYCLQLIHFKTSQPTPWNFAIRTMTEVTLPVITAFITELILCMLSWFCEALLHQVVFSDFLSFFSVPRHP